MNTLRLCLAVACLAPTSLAVSQVDLSRIDRSIAREPAYQTHTPRYCLLVFGPECKHSVWLVLDGDTLYFDKNGNGDLTDEGERVEAPAFSPSIHPAHQRERSIAAGEITIGGLTHTELTVSQTQYRRKADVSNGAGASTPDEWQEYLDSIWSQVPDGLVNMVSIQLELEPKCYGLFENAEGRRVLHFAWIDGHGQLVFAARPKEAPIIHLGGPLTLHNVPKELCRGSEPTKTTLCLGTPGVGPGTFATMAYDLVPKGSCPKIEVQFPARQPGPPPVTREYVLKERC